MPDTTIVQNPAILWDEVSHFPHPRWEDILPTSPGHPWGRYGLSAGGTLRENSFTKSYMARTNNMAAAGAFVAANPGGPTYIQVSSVGVGQGIVGLDAMRVECDVGTAFALADGAARSSPWRVHWLTWLMQSNLANPDERCGLIYQPFLNGNNVRWPGSAFGVNCTGGFGFNGDGAGQFQYSSYSRAGGFAVREQVALPAHDILEYNQCELVIIGERFGIPATLDIYFNSVFIGNRNWTGALLESYAANEWCYLPTMGGGSAGVGGGSINIADVVCRKGRYTRDGVEV